MQPEFSRTDIAYEISYNPNFVPRQFSKANIKTVTIDEEKKYFLKNHETGDLYDLGEFGNGLWNLIDGKRTVKEIIETLASTYKDLRQDSVRDFLVSFAEEGLLEAIPESAPKKRLEIVSAFMVRVKLIWDSNNFIDSIHRMIRPLLRRSLLWPILILGAIMGMLYAGSFVSIFATKENFEIMGSTVVGFFFYYFIALAPVIVLHELSHALALRHYGGAPREMGTGLYFFGPMFYVDTTDGWTLGRYERIMISAAGSITELTIASLIMISQYLMQFPPFVSHVLTMIVFYIFYGMLINLSPLMQTDGYLILSDSLKMPDLRGKSFGYLQALVARLFGKPIDKEMKRLTKKTKTILLIYAILAAFWGVYLVYRSLTIATYMAQDTATSVLNVSSGLISNSLTMTVIVLSIASVLYFTMVMSGYGLIVFTGLKKAIKTTLQFSEVHDRELSLFLYVPNNVSESLYSALTRKVTKTAKSFTRNFSVRRIGPICLVVLRMSRAKLAFVQIKEHFQNVEKRFDIIYENFLKHHKSEVLKTVGVHDPEKTNLAFILSQMAEQASRAGMPETKGAVSEIISRQTKNALYLLHSVYGRVWNVELSPNLLNEFGKTLNPSLLVEDISVTNLYDDVEEFKKRTIYGFDTLAQLACDNQKCLQDSICSPEKYQIICSFEPIKSRLVFLGRTEAIGKIMDSFGTLFVSQVWCGYLDNLLSEINLSLLSLNQVSAPTRKSLRSMKDGELTILGRNLASLINNKEFVKEAWANSKRHAKSANRALEGLERDTNSIGDFKISAIDAALKVNLENLAHLPSQLQSFRVLSQELYKRLQTFERQVRKERAKREASVERKKKRRRNLSLFFIALSTILAFVGIWQFSGYMAEMFIIIALSIQVAFWSAHILFLNSLKTVSRYPTPNFRQAHFYTLAFTESLYEFMATVNLLTPSEQKTIQMNDQTRLKK
jgi:putative peptide zinc metalloprotease protein